MMAGSVVFNRLLKTSSGGDCRLLLMGIVQSSWESQMVVGTIFITPGTQLLGGLHLTFNEAIALWVVGTACETPVGS